MAGAENGYRTLKNIGGSLPVENVQWLATLGEESKLPERYVRPEIIAEPVLNNEEENGEIPVIDLSKLLHVQQKEEEMMKLGLACQEWGFFQILNHGVPEEVIESMKCEIQGFFQLPSEEKKIYSQQPGSLEGYGQAFVVSEEQKLDWGDMYFLATQPPIARNMELWPSNPPAFRAALDQYSLELKRVASILVKSMAECLGVEGLADSFIDGLQSMRINYYPACRQASKVLGLSPHSDAVGLTLLLQINQVQGLQIKKNGGWMPIKPLPGAFIVNIGDILEIMSNGKYKSIEHRAVINPKKERISIAAFHSPRLDAPIGPIRGLVGGSEELYKTISSLDYMKLITSSKLQGKNFLEQMKLKKRTGNGNLNLKNTGGSLPVPNVQSLAASRDCDDQILKRYIRPKIDDSPVLNGVAKHGDIPIIDLSRLDHVQHSEDEIAKLSLACEDWGFFQLINHGVPDEVIEKMKVVIEDFFGLPLEEKKAYEQLPGTVEGYGQTFVVSEEQKLDWGDMYFLSTRPVPGRNLKLWPKNPPTFKDALDQYSQEIQRVADVLLGSIGKSLKLDKLIGNFKGGIQAIRINYYPPCPQASKVLGLSPHSDAVGLTVLLQVNEVQGLQIKKNGAWLPIKPLPGAFIVNVGDIIEIMSNGKYRSIEHRAVVDPERERLSIATFHSPRMDAYVGPLPEALEKNEPYYKTINMQDYVRMLFSSKLEGKNILDHMKLEA